MKACLIMTLSIHAWILEIRQSLVSRYLGSSKIYTVVCCSFINCSIVIVDGDIKSFLDV